MEQGKKASCTSAAQPAQPSTSASAGSAAQPAGESKQLPALDAPSPRASTEESPLPLKSAVASPATAGRAALQTIAWNTTESGAISAAISAGRGARAEHPTFEILYKAMPKKRPRDPPTRTPLTGPATATESSVPAVLSKAMPHDLLTKKLRANMVPPSSSTATSASSAKVPSAKVEYAINLSDSD